MVSKMTKTRPHAAGLTSAVMSWLLAAATAILLANCSGTPSTSTSVPNPNAAPGTFGAVYNTLYTKCLECHKPGGQASVDYNVQLDFSSQANAYSTLTAGFVQSAQSMSCQTVRIVNTTTPAYSYLLAAVVPGYSTSNFAGVTGCTPAANHFSILSLTATEQQDLVTWIQSGAQNN